MQAITHHLHSFSIPERIKSAFSKLATKETFEKISRIANHVFLHLTVSLAINIAFDVAFGVLVLPVSAHVLTIACGVALAVVIALKIAKWAYDHFHSKSEESSKAQARVNLPVAHVDKIATGIADFSIVNTLMLKVSTYIHEAGHALAAMACFVNASPQIIVKWASGLTEYNISYGLTRFGTFLGEEASRIFVTSAGLFTPALFAIVEFSLAYGLHDKLPEVSDALNYHGLSQLLNVGLYGLTAFTSSKMALAHDFIYLWHIGKIHPAVAITLLIGIPLCAFLAFKYLEYRKNTHILI
jgi:hypothetical protein